MPVSSSLSQWNNNLVELSQFQDVVPSATASTAIGTIFYSGPTLGFNNAIISMNVSAANTVRVEVSNDNSTWTAFGLSHYYASIAANSTFLRSNGALNVATGNQTFVYLIGNFQFFRIITTTSAITNVTSPSIRLANTTANEQTQAMFPGTATNALGKNYGLVSQSTDVGVGAMMVRRDGNIGVQAGNNAYLQPSVTNIGAQIVQNSAENRKSYSATVTNLVSLGSATMQTTQTVTQLSTSANTGGLMIIRGSGSSRTIINKIYVDVASSVVGNGLVQILIQKQTYTGVPGYTNNYAVPTTTLVGSVASTSVVMGVAGVAGVGLLGATPTNVTNVHSKIIRLGATSSNFQEISLIMENNPIELTSSQFLSVHVLASSQNINTYSCSAYWYED